MPASERTAADGLGPSTTVLLAPRALSDHGAIVAAIDRAELPSAAGTRRGVPQARPETSS